MLIRCPHCIFSREVPEEQIPAGTTRIQCPKCKQRFDLPRVAEVTEVTEPESAMAPVQEPEPAAPPEPEAQEMKDAEFNATAKPAAAGELRLAGFWIRVAASIIDSILVTMVQLLMVFIFGLATSALMDAGGYGDHQVAAAVGITGQLFAIFVALFYYVFMTGYCGQTLGKKAMGIRVVDIDGSPIGYGCAFIREVPGKFISTVLLGIGYLMVAFTRKKQGLHDKIASTLVIRT